MNTTTSNVAKVVKVIIKPFKSSDNVLRVWVECSTLLHQVKHLSPI